MTEYQTHTALVQSLEAEVSRLRVVNAELRASIQKSVQADTALSKAARQAIALLGPEAPLCSGCEYEWNQAIKLLKEALGETK